MGFKDRNLCKVHGSVHRKYILIYIQQDATLHSLFISGNYSTCFGLYLYPSSGAQNCIYSIWHLSNRNCYLPLSWRSWKSGISNSSIIATGSSYGLTSAKCCRYSFCAPDDGWRYNPKHVEQFPEINKLYNVATCWIYIRIP